LKQRNQQKFNFFKIIYQSSFPRQKAEFFSVLKVRIYDKTRNKSFKISFKQALYNNNLSKALSQKMKVKF